MFDTDHLQQFYERVLLRSLGQEVEVESYALVTGGDVNTAVCLQTEEGYYFLKYRAEASRTVFEAEASGLALLETAEAIDVPAVLGFGETDGYGYLLLEFIESNMPGRTYWEQLGQRVARLHRYEREGCGLAQDNYLGIYEQSNAQGLSWPVFWAQERLLPLAGMALLAEALPLETFKRIEQLNAMLPELLPAQSASLLHGDLWNGNIMPNTKGLPTLFDPAVYFGHREVDIAMTRLFGGFPTSFYHAYQEEWPLEPGWTDRLEIYTLYPLLVHLNSFGSGYLSGIDKVLRRFKL